MLDRIQQDNIAVGTPSKNTIGNAATSAVEMGTLTLSDSIRVVKLLIHSGIANLVLNVTGGWEDVSVE